MSAMGNLMAWAERWLSREKGMSDAVETVSEEMKKLLASVRRDERNRIAVILHRESERLQLLADEGGSPIYIFAGGIEAAAVLVEDDAERVEKSSYEENAEQGVHGV